QVKSDKAKTGTVSCPAGTVVLGGGAKDTGIGVTIFTDSLAASHPLSDGSGASAEMDNLSLYQSSFVVHAVCANRPKGYALVHASTSVPAGSQKGAGAACPTGTKVLGGGGTVAQAGSAWNSINSTYPFSIRKWDVDANNTGTTAYGLTVNA